MTPGRTPELRSPEPRSPEPRSPEPRSADLVGSILIRCVRLVRVGTDPVHPGPVDVRVERGQVTEVAPRLERQPAEAVLEADGRWALPGLWDTHVHLLQWAQTLDRLDLSRTRGPSEVVDTVARHIALLPDEPTAEAATVFGWGHRSATWHRPGTVAELDAVSRGRPVVLISGDAHNGWLNSRALELLGVPLQDGPLDENDWFAILPRLGGLPGGNTRADHLERAVADAAAKGVVGIVDFEFAPNHLDWPERRSSGLRRLRVRTGVYPADLEDVIASGLRTGDRLVGGDGLLTMGPLKVISDGSLNTRTAHCRSPYADAADLEFPYGKQNYSADELTALLHRAKEHGLEAAVHAIGDAALDSAITAFAASGVRGSVEHAQLIGDGDAARLAALGVRASVQPAHLVDDRDVTEHCWPGRGHRSLALRSLLDAGVELTMGSDAPVAPLDPWLAMATAVHRSGDQRSPWHPEESLTVQEALVASTDRQRTLAVGSRGDIVLVDEDPLGPQGDSADVAAHLRGMSVSGTFVSGRATHTTF